MMGSSSRSPWAVASHCRTELLACVPAAPQACFPFLPSSPLVAIKEEPARHASRLMSCPTHPPLPGVSPFEGQPNSSRRLNQNLGWPWCQRQSFQIQACPDSTALLLLFAVSLAAHTHVTYMQPLLFLETPCSFFTDSDLSFSQGTSHANLKLVYSKGFRTQFLFLPCTRYYFILFF